MSRGPLYDRVCGRVPPSWMVQVARAHGRHAIGVDLNADYLDIAARRTQQLGLLTGEAA